MDEFQIERLSPEDEECWDRLAVETAAAPFLRPGWVRAWVGAFGGGADLCTATVRRRNALVGVLPILRCGSSLVSPANAETPRVGAVVADQSAVQQLVRGVVECGARRVDLNFLPADDPTTSVLRGTERGEGRDFLWHSVRRQPFIDVYGTASEYESRRLSTRRRRDLRRQERRLAGMGAVELEIHRGDQCLEVLVDEGFRMEVQGWKGRAGTAVLSRQASRQFYSSMARWGAQAGILRLAFLRVDGRSVAFSFALEQNAVHYGLKLCYDESFATFGPGLLLMHRLIHRAFDQPEIARFEMLGEADDYKMEFADGATEQFRVRIFGRGAWGVVDRAIVEAQHGARQAARQHLPQTTRVRLNALAARLGR